MNVYGFIRAESVFNKKFIHYVPKNGLLMGLLECNIEYNLIYNNIIFFVELEHENPWWTKDDFIITEINNYSEIFSDSRETL